SGVIGAYVSAVGNGLPTGPAIVIAASVTAVISLLFAPKRGIINRAIKRKRNRLKLTVTMQNEENGRERV
ncbi:MAG: metal ABC transporter permease, partial [Ruminococcaceae bacterium]|nr:metal ABC transporter permease [Oscillospiraceae bacterium]